MEEHWARVAHSQHLAQLHTYMNANAGTGGNYDVPEDLSGSSYFSSASKPLLNNEEISQNATYFQEAMALQKQLPNPMLNPYLHMNYQQQHMNLRGGNPDQISSQPEEEAAANSADSMKLKQMSDPVVSADDDEPSDSGS